MATLRSMAAPNHAGKATMHACLEALNENRPIREIAEHVVLESPREKPFKPLVFALSQFLYQKIWEDIQKDMPNIVASLNRRGRYDESVLLSIITKSSAFAETIVHRFRNYLQRLRTGRIIIPDSLQAGNYVQALDLLIQQGQTDLYPDVAKDIQRQITTSVRNAVASIMSPLINIPEVYRTQFNQDITGKELEEIVLNLKEMIVLQARLHVYHLSAISKEISLDLVNEKTVHRPESYVLGFNSRNQLSMVVRPEYVEKAKAEATHESPQLGCAMLQIVSEFHDLVWQVIRPVFDISSPEKLTHYYRDMRELREQFMSHRDIIDSIQNYLR